MCFYQQYQIANFINLLEPTLNKLRNNRVNYTSVGDLNIETLHFKTRPQINNFVNFTYEKCLHMMINKPTRFPVGNQQGRPPLIFVCK